MKHTALACALTAVALCFPLQVLAVDQPLDLSPIFADVSANYAGNEMIVPYVAASDSNFDGVPDSAAIRLRIYTPGTATTGQVFRYATPGRTVTLPANPCFAPALTEWMFNAKPLRVGTLVAVGYDYTLMCYENISYELKLATKTAVYVADAALPNGLAWALGYTRSLVGFNLLDDLNGNGIQELMITTQAWDDPTGVAYTEIRDLQTKLILNKGAFPTQQ
jgi:hypothetical protein